MRLTTWAEYGVIVALHLARRADPTPVPAHEIARQEALPPDYVEQILLKLRRAGLVTSVRGARGGYRLAREAGRITVRHVVAATEDSTFEVNCDRHPVGPDRCNPGAQCSVRPVWRALQRQIDDLLDRVSLTDLLRKESEVERLVSSS